MSDFNNTQNLSYWQKNKDILIAKAKAKYEANKEQLRAQSRLYYKNNNLYFKCKLYKSKNKEQIRARARERYRIRYSNDVQFKLVETLRSRVCMAIRSQGTQKRVKTEELLGCTIDVFKRYIEAFWLPGMSWENHTLKGWHIDHIRPVNTFDLTNLEQQKVCFHYTNLRPMWASDNQSRPKDGSDVRKKF